MAHLCLSDGEDVPTVDSSGAFLPPADRTSLEFTAYVADVEIDIALADKVTGTLTLHFKELPAGVFRRFALDNQNDNEDVRVDSMARIVAAGLVTPEGKPALTFEQAKRLKAEPMLRIFEAIQEVNAPDPKVTTSGDSGTS